MAAAEPSSSSAPIAEFKSEEVAELLAKGKRHYVCQEAALACACFEKASSLLAERYGQTSDECGEAYLYYGKSLLDLARMEGGVFGSAIQEAKADTSDEEDDGASGDDGEADEKDEPEAAAATSNGHSAEVDREDKEDDADEADENVPNMQLSWEMVELAKAIISRSNSKERQLKLAECLSTLGEISLELEHYDEAAIDFGECLRIKKEHLATDSRELAEVNYQLGLCKMFKEDFKSSLVHFTNAQSCIKLRAENIKQSIADLEKDVSGKQKASPDSEIEKLRKELEDLNSLVPEITAKIEDLNEMEKSREATVKAMKSAAQQLMGQSTSAFDSPFSSSSGTTQVSSIAPRPAASDITHLVRKKVRPATTANLA